MTQQAFVSRREAFWNEFESLVQKGGKNLKRRAVWFPRGYRELTQDLNTARAHGFDPSIIDRLNYLVQEGNQILYGQRSFFLRGAADFILKTFPRTVRSQWRSLGAVTLIFYGLAFFFGYLCVRFPDMVYEILGARQAMSLESMYDPESSYYLTPTPRGVSTDADMFGFYIYNNVSITFRTFAGGMLAGIGSLLFLCVNGVFLGAAAGYIVSLGYGSTFFPFVIGHSSFELTALVLTAQGGLLLGYRLFFTRGLSRAASIKAAGKTALPLVAGAALMDVIAAAIEAFWSSRHMLPLKLRYGVGAALWALLFLYFLLAGRKEK